MPQPGLQGGGCVVSRLGESPVSLVSETQLRWKQRCLRVQLFSCVTLDMLFNFSEPFFFPRYETRLRIPTL